MTREGRLKKMKRLSEIFLSAKQCFPNMLVNNDLYFVVKKLCKVIKIIIFFYT